MKRDSFNENRIKRAIIFDLDGTLWDTTAQLTLIWNQVFEKRNIDLRLTKDDLRGIMGMTIQETGRFLFPNKTENEQMDILQQCSGEHIAYLKKNGAVLLCDADKLNMLSSTYDLYIVSNCPCGYIEAFLESHKMYDYFKDYEMSGRTGKSKGENIRILRDRNHIEAAVYVGDTQKNEDAARQAGTPFIYARYGFGQAVSPDAVIDNLSELDMAAQKLLL